MTRTTMKQLYMEITNDELLVSDTIFKTSFDTSLSTIYLVQCKDQYVFTTNTILVLHYFYLWQQIII